MIPFASPPRPFSGPEQLIAYIFRARLEPLATRLASDAQVSRTAAVAPPRPASQRRELRVKQIRRDFRRRSREALEREAARQAPPCGLGVIELFILRWVIGQLLNWIMREWLEGKDGDDADQDD